MSHLFYELNFKDVEDLQSGKATKKVSAAISLGIRDGLRDIEEHHKKKFFLRGQGKSMKTHPTKITWRTGNLAKSYITYWRKGNQYGYYGSTLKRAALLEHGGTIKPVTAKALAIPTQAAKVGVGGTLTPRDFPPGELFIPKWPSGAGVLARIGKGGKLEVMFVFAKSVTIKSRPTVAKTAKATGPAFELMMAKRIQKAMDKK